MPKHAYRSEEERRIAATFSIREKRLRWFREALAQELGHEPDQQECIKALRSLAQAAVDDFVKRRIEIEEAIIL